MTVQEINQKYDALAEKAEPGMERNMIEAERKHQLKMAEQGIDAEKGRNDSQFECVGCGS